MRGVELHAGEARGYDALTDRDEPLPNARDLRGREFTRAPISAREGHGGAGGGREWVGLHHLLVCRPGWEICTSVGVPRALSAQRRSATSSVRGSMTTLRARSRCPRSIITLPVMTRPAPPAAAVR